MTTLGLAITVSFLAVASAAAHHSQPVSFVSAATAVDPGQASWESARVNPPPAQALLAEESQEPRPPPAPARPTEPGRPPAAAGPTVVKGRLGNVSTTFYDCKGQGFCGTMYNGQKVYEGAAACSFDLPLGTRFRIPGDPTGRVYRCDDRGLLTATWVDIFWYDPADGWAWQSAVGRVGSIEIVDIQR